VNAQLPECCKTFIGKLNKVTIAQLVIPSMMIFAVLALANCAGISVGDTNSLSQRTRLDLVDWHISGLWVINSPVAWFRVTNYNDVPIKEISLEYQTYTSTGQPLDKGTYTIEGSVAPHTTKNFIEQYIGLVDLNTERLSVQLKEVRPGTGGGH
jgi:hypothetical protein